MQDENPFEFYVHDSDIRPGLGPEPNLNMTASNTIVDDTLIDIYNVGLLDITNNRPAECPVEQPNSRLTNQPPIQPIVQSPVQPSTQNSESSNPNIQIKFVLSCTTIFWAFIVYSSMTILVIDCIPKYDRIPAKFGSYSEWVQTPFIALGLLINIFVILGTLMRIRVNDNSDYYRIMVALTYNGLVVSGFIFAGQTLVSFALFNELVINPITYACGFIVALGWVGIILLLNAIGFLGYVCTWRRTPE